MSDLRPGMIDEPALMAWSGYHQRAKLEAWLRERHIPYMHGRGGKLITTQAAIDAALAGAAAIIGPEPIEFS